MTSHIIQVPGQGTESETATRKGITRRADHLEELQDLDVTRKLLVQETEKGMLFARKSRWKDLKGSLRQLLGGIGRHLTLWKTSIQTIEARHGECLDHTAVC